MARNSGEDPAVTVFREYLRIPSVHPNVNYDECVAFIKKQAKSLNLPCKVYVSVPKKPVVVITWEGTEPQLPSVLLNSHMDVVPVYKDEWTHDPFGAEKDEKGNIYARGTQDMKSVGIQYLEAVRRLRADGIKLRHTVHISFVPDEEIGGADGIQNFVNTEDFKSLNVGFALDEGVASEEDHFTLFMGERVIWQMRINCPGTTGHGSAFIPDTAGGKLRVVIDRFLDYRQREMERLASNPDLEIGDVTTVNFTRVEGGVQTNVVPAMMTAYFDCRIAVDVDLEELEKMFRGWCSEAGHDVELHFTQQGKTKNVTHLNESNPWWGAFKKASDAMGLQLKPVICQGATDARFIRDVGVPALGFSPMNRTPILLHANDEFLNESVFLRGIEIYYNLIASIANIPQSNT